MLVPDKIHLLPDHIANQIAAGEVIQRPASAVKELLENAVDAGASKIDLIIQDAGKQLVQIIDNGSGMSTTDARMAFERHATSKINSIDDLFKIKTMGFRGEALASIAAVAQIELKTKRAEDTSGTFIEIENSVVEKQEPIAIPDGTSIAMKNLFFNVPARRNFLKSNAAEMRHIIDEFIRVSMAYPDRFFSLTANGQKQFHLDPGTLKQRIIQLLGNTYQTKLVSVSQQTDYLNIFGFIGKPETAKKTRGDQYLFVNNRFIKSAYLNHAIGSAFQEMISEDSHPAYVLFLELDPAQIDINVHPTKQEIKFEDEKIIYAFVQAAVKHALAQFNITPTLDFELDAGIQQLDAVSKPFSDQQKAAASASSIYKSFTERNAAHKIDPGARNAVAGWGEFFEGGQTQTKPSAGFQSLFAQATEPQDQLNYILSDDYIQVNRSFIITEVNSRLHVFHQQNTHETILYRRFLQELNNNNAASQQSLFPVTLNVSPQDAALLHELLPDLQKLGYMIEPFGGDSFVVRGTPVDMNEEQISGNIELLLEQYKHYQPDIQINKTEKLIRALARQRSIKLGQALSKEEMNGMIVELLSNPEPKISPGGKLNFFEIKNDDLLARFGK
ncbi:MAG: DNA mismatch repair endonuclease MutL [Bacteroidota bacterium]